MTEETVLIALLCFIVGFLLRAEIQRLRKRKEEVKEK